MHGEPRKESPYTRQNIDHIVDRYVGSGEMCSKPRGNFSYGTNPYINCADRPFVPTPDIQFTPINELRSSDVFPDLWLRLKTESGSTYTLHVVESPDTEGQIVTIGTAVRHDIPEFVVGRLKLPELERPVEFSEFAHCPNIEQVRDVRYISPDELKDRVREQILSLYEEMGDEWLHQSSGIENSPTATELKPLKTTPVKKIEVGL